MFTGSRKDRRATSSRCFGECPLWLSQARATKAGGHPNRAHRSRGPSGPRRRQPPLHVVGDADRPRLAWFANRVTQQLRRGHLRPNCIGSAVCVAVATLPGEERDISVAAQPSCRAPFPVSEGTVGTRKPRSPSRPGPRSPHPGFYWQQVARPAVALRETKKGATPPSKRCDPEGAAGNGQRGPGLLPVAPRLLHRASRCAT